jgi:carbonic anhydrase/acetyltransferase-like protein (isoleucine patch superfamily)
VRDREHIHGCHIGPRTIIEPGAIVCDGSTIGADSVGKAGAVVKQRSTFHDRSEIDGFPADAVAGIDVPGRPGWALDPDHLPSSPHDGLHQTRFAT